MLGIAACAAGAITRTAASAAVAASARMAWRGVTAKPPNLSLWPAPQSNPEAARMRRFASGEQGAGLGGDQVRALVGDEVAAVRDELRRHLVGVRFPAGDEAGAEDRVAGAEHEAGRDGQALRHVAP